MTGNPFINTTSGLAPNAGVVGIPNAITGTSTTSQTIAVGSLQFQVQPQAAWAPGMFVSVVSAASNNNFMTGVVQSYSGTALTVNVLSMGGSGTFADWLINLSGTTGLSAGTYNGTLTVDGTINDTQADFILDDPAGTAQGPVIIFKSAGTVIGGVGQKARLNGSGVSQDIVLQSQLSNNTIIQSLNGSLYLTTKTYVPRLTIDNNGLSTWAAVPGLVEAVFKNLKITNGGTPDSQAVLTADQVCVSNAVGSYITFFNLSLTTSTGTSGANGLDTGSIANSTWYSYWVIYDETTNTVSALLSASATAPTLPSGYTYKARFGWIRTDSSGNLKTTLQLGRSAQYVITGTSPNASLGLMASGETSGANVATGNFVPPTASKAKVSLYSATATSDCSVYPNSNYSGTGNIPMYSSGESILLGEIMLESSNLYWVSNISSSNTLSCFGWEDNI